MAFLEGEIQRQLSVNAIALTNKVKRSNFGQTIMALLYIMVNIMGVRQKYAYVWICFLSQMHLMFLCRFTRWNEKAVFKCIPQVYNRYITQSGITQGDILYTIGAAVEDGTYQGNTLRNLMTLDTSCRREFKKLAKKAALEHAFNGMFGWMDGDKYSKLN